MKIKFYPLQMLLFTLSGWVNRHQQDGGREVRCRERLGGLLKHDYRAA